MICRVAERVRQGLMEGRAGHGSRDVTQLEACVAGGPGGGCPSERETDLSAGSGNG
jgi:hypothetical protein